MSGIIKLFYKTEIRLEISEAYSKDASKIDATVKAIFDDNHWKPGLFENAKKKAIRSVLREEIAQKKVENLPQLLVNIRTKKGNKLLTDEDILSVSKEVQKKHPEYSLSEIHYAAKHYDQISGNIQSMLRQDHLGYWSDNVSEREKLKLCSQIQKEAKIEHNLWKAEQLPHLLQKITQKIHEKKIQYLTPEIIQSLSEELQKEEPEYSLAEIHHILLTRIGIRNIVKNKLETNASYKPSISNREKLKIFQEIHKDAKADQTHFSHELELVEKRISRALNISDEEIDREILTRCKDKPLEPGLTHLEIRFRLESITPELRRSKFGDLVAIARLTERVDAMSYDDIGLLLSYLLPKPGAKEQKKENRDHQAILEASETLKSILSKRAKSDSPLVSDQKGKLLSKLANKFEEALDATGLPTIGGRGKRHPKDQTNRPRLFSALLTLSNDQAHNILNYLNNPTKMNLAALSLSEKRVLAKLWFTVQGGERETRAEIRKINDNSVEFGKFLPNLPEPDHNLFLDILKKIHERRIEFATGSPDKDLIIDMFSERLETVLDTLNKSDLSPRLQSIMNHDAKTTNQAQELLNRLGYQTKHLPIEKSNNAEALQSVKEIFNAIPNNLRELKALDVFIEEQARTPEFIITTKNEKHTIPAFYENPWYITPDIRKVPIFIGLLETLHAFAKGDEVLFLQLQSLCSQTIFNETCERIYIALPKSLGIYEEDKTIPLSNISLDPNRTRITLNYISDTEISSKTDVILTVKDVINNKERPFTLTVIIPLLKDEQGYWVTQTPHFSQLTPYIPAAAGAVSVEPQKPIEPFPKKQEEA